MAAPTLNSISPLSGPPGSVVTCLGAGFTAGSQVGCPMLVDTTFVGAGELTAVIPADLSGADGSSMPVSVYVRNEDGSTSALLTFTVLFGRVKQQTYTSIEAVTGEIPGFVRGGKITDAQIGTWMRSIAQSINAAMLRRGLSLDPADWQAADAGSAMPDPSSVLELINRYGAASRLAAAIGAQFSSGGEWPLAKNLDAAFRHEMKALENGSYDKVFKPTAAAIETGAKVWAGDVTSAETGEVERAFEKDMEF